MCIVQYVLYNDAHHILSSYVRVCMCSLHFHAISHTVTRFFLCLFVKILNEYLEAIIEFRRYILRSIKIPYLYSVYVILFIYVRRYAVP
jgi:hypothetical protein